MAEYRELDDLAHRFLGNIPVAPWAKGAVHGGRETESDLDPYSRRDDALRRSGSRDVDEGGGVARREGISAIVLNEPRNVRSGCGALSR